MSILVDGLPQVGALIHQLNELSKPLSNFKKTLRELLLDSDQILKIGHDHPIEEISLATVDGAVAVQQMAFANLVVSGASLGEGYASKHLYETEHDYPSLSYLNLLQHQSRTAKTLPPGVMSAQEIALIGYLEHDVTALDGSWLSGLTSVYLSLLESEVASEAILSTMLQQRLKKGWDGKELLRGIDRITSPWRYKDSNKDLIALSKSDSSMVWARRIAKLFGDKLPALNGFELTDRVLAGIALRPGEMFRPIYVDAGRSLSPRLSYTQSKEAKVFDALKNLIHYLTPQEADFLGIDSPDQLTEQMRVEREEFLTSCVDELMLSAYKDSELPSENRSIGQRLKEMDSSPGSAWVWATYFIPHDQPDNSRALRIEFTRDYSDFDTYANEVDGEWGDYSVAVNLEQGGFDDVVVDKSRRLVSMVDQDMSPSPILEPWSQYVADRQAKQVAELAETAKNELANAVEDPYLLAGLLSNYRT